MSLPSAFILAGGRSSRMGQDKALTLLADIPLIQRACELFRSIGLDPRIAGAQSDLSLFAPTLPDKPGMSGLGPLAGVCSALATTSAQFAVFLPVDLPLLPASLITYLIHHATITQSAATIVSLAGFIQTFPVVIDTGALRWLVSSLHSEDRNTLRAFRAASDQLSRPMSVLPIELLAQAGEVSCPSARSSMMWFLNINSPADLLRAERLIAEPDLQVI